MTDVAHDADLQGWLPGSDSARSGVTRGSDDGELPGPTIGLAFPSPAVPAMPVRRGVGPQHAVADHRKNGSED
jgi:hypothetical protein